MTKSQAIKAMRELADRLEASGLPEETDDIVVKLQLHEATAAEVSEFMNVSDLPPVGNLYSGIAWYQTTETADDPQVIAFLKMGLTH
jgi:hypothetical protein